MMYNRLPLGLVQREENEDRNHLDSAQAEITQRTYCVGDVSEYDLPSSSDESDIYR